MSDHLTDFFAMSISKQGIKPATMADSTYITGAIIDRHDVGNALSMMVQGIIAFTTASGAGGATNVLTLEIQHGAASDLADAALYDSDTYTYTWAADGANSGMHVLPTSLKAAKRYVRARMKITEDGTITSSAWVGGFGYTFGGGNIVPDSGWAAAGHEETTEPSA